MGCIISCCCGSEDDETGEYGERTRLVSECNTQTQVKGSKFAILVIKAVGYIYSSIAVMLSECSMRSHDT